MRATGLGRQTTGDPKAERVLVFLPGALMGSTVWHPQHIAVDGEYRVFVDLPGQGLSRHLRWRSMEDSARRVLQLIDEVSPDHTVDLIGLSLGGDLGVRVVSRGPQRINSAVLSGMISRPQRPWGEAWEAWKGVVKIRDDEYRKMFADYNNLPESERAQFFRETCTVRYSDYARTLASVYRGMDLEALRPVRTPILAVCGETEHLVATESVKDLVANGPSVTGVMTKSTGHNWNTEDPQAFERIVQAWTRRQELDPSLIEIA